MEGDAASEKGATVVLALGTAPSSSTLDSYLEDPPDAKPFYFVLNIAASALPYGTPMGWKPATAGSAAASRTRLDFICLLFLSETGRGSEEKQGVASLPSCQIFEVITSVTPKTEHQKVPTVLFREVEYEPRTIVAGVVGS